MLVALLLSSGFAAVIAMSRAGIRIFWLPLETTPPRVRLIEIAPILGLLLLSGILTVQARPVVRFIEAAAESLHAPDAYIHGVLGPNWPPAPDREHP
jgi:multicomponent K+:H+ antiporter subunit D